MLRWTVVTLAGWVCALPGSGQPPIAAPPPPPSTAALTEYLDEARLSRRLNELVAAHPRDCSLATIGVSRGGRDLWVLTLGRGAPTDRRTALAIVAGLDGDHPATTDIAVRVAEALLNRTPAEGTADPLEGALVYVLPRVHPDGCAALFAAPRAAQRRTLRPVDDDRDGSIDEDGPDDVNCDGVITLMRVRDPDATHLPDPAEPRLLKEPDRAKGQKPIYKVYPEGIDDDGDGEYNEDGLGGVDVNRNFMHGYREHEPGAGPYPGCEPESRTLIDFFLAHPNICVTVVYGRHDNIVKPPDSGKMDATHRAPLGLHADDAAFYEQISKRYRQITGLKEVPKDDEAGAFFAWSYAQFGVPTFACRVWTRPEQSKAVAPPAVEPPPPTGEAEAQTQSAAQAPAPEKPETPRPEETRPGAQDAAKPDEKVEPADKEAAGWLAYSDAQREGQGFVAWASFEHPQLGTVEIGGFEPFFQTTPPTEELDALASRQTEFIVDLAQRFPAPQLAEPTVEPLAARVYELEAAVINEGYFPTATAMGRQTRRTGPILVTLELPLERILAGERLSRFWSIPGSGGREKLRWVILAEPGETVGITMTSNRFGTAQQTVTLPNAAPGSAP